MIISEMQRKLATWAATDPPQRIDRLLRLIAQPDWLAATALLPCVPQLFAPLPKVSSVLPLSSWW
ncbi:hypothetical protein B9K09_06260 [Pseudomonas sp. M30-35]|nr:hypothetical protein B9K09_06260 [Pseudomonas sp. M30-35]